MIPTQHMTKLSDLMPKVCILCFQIIGFGFRFFKDFFCIFKCWFGFCFSKIHFAFSNVAFFLAAGPHSVKRWFTSMLFGKLLGYADNFELLQFVYDMNLWTTLGARRNLEAAPMRIMMKGSSFTPLYWHAVKCGLVDLVRQCGFPKIFWTMAPYEWSQPYHHFIRDEMTKTLNARLHLPAAETAHLVPLEKTMF